MFKIDEYSIKLNIRLFHYAYFISFDGLIPDSYLFLLSIVTSTSNIDNNFTEDL